MTDETQTAAEYWENRYRTNGRSWSGNVNASLEREITGVAPGTALDLGCGEGGDALWLAHNGWTVTAVDIAPSALAIGQAAQQPEDDIHWVAADLAEWHPSTTFDLVTSSFLHSEVEIPRDDILRRAAGAVAPGGILLIVGHAGVTHWHHSDDGHEPPALPTAGDVFETLFADGSSLRRDDWTVLVSAEVERIATGPDGSTGPITDAVLKLRRDR